MTQTIKSNKFRKIIKALLGKGSDSVEGWCKLYNSLSPTLKRLIRNTNGNYKINIVLLDDKNNEVATIGEKI
jgi:hypothetical protein